MVVWMADWRNLRYIDRNALQLSHGFASVDIMRNGTAMHKYNKIFLRRLKPVKFSFDVSLPGA